MGFAIRVGASFGQAIGRAATVAAWLAGSVLLSVSQAATLKYALQDVADTVAGQDLWQVQYVQQEALGAFESLNVLFDPALYADLSLLGQSDELNVSVLLTQPDAGLGADGQLLLTAATDLGVSYQGSVDLSFVWLGAGKPGSQPFEALDDGFNVVATGVTTPVPEAQGILLALAGLLPVGLALRRRQGRHVPR